MHDQRACRALPRRFLELIRPAAVIGHPLALERAALVLGVIVRIVDQDDRDLPLHVDPGIVVPAEFRGIDPVTDKDQRRIGQAGFRHGAVRTGHVIVAIGKAQRLSADLDRQRRIVRPGDFQRRHFLGPAALVARLQASLGKALDDIGDRLVLTRRGRGAAFVSVGRQFARDRIERFDRDLRRGHRRNGKGHVLGRAGRNGGSGQGSGKGGDRDKRLGGAGHGKT